MDSIFLNYGKLGVVIGVIAIIFIVIVAFLIYLERRIHRLENNTKQN